MKASERPRSCYCAACLLTAPECLDCGAPMTVKVHERQGGVCTACIPHNPTSFRAARDRVIAEVAEETAERRRRSAQRRRERLGSRGGR